MGAGLVGPALTDFELADWGWSLKHHAMGVHFNFGDWGCMATGAEVEGLWWRN